MAAASGYHDVVNILLHHKCTVDTRDHDTVTPLYLATYYGNYEVMKMLVGAFANVNAVTKVILFELFSPLLFKFPGLPTIRSLTVCKNGRGRSGPFYHVNDVSVYLGRHRGGGVPD